MRGAKGARDAAGVALPEAFAARVVSELGAAEGAALLAALALPPTSGLRLRAQDGPVDAFLARLGWRGAPLAWSPEGSALEPLAGAAGGRHPASLHPWQDAGAYYLQDPSAMGVVPVLAPQPGERILDLAAAPGGKSTYIADRLAGSGLLWSHDVDPHRVDALIGNLERWGVANAVVSQGPVELLAPLRGAFDRVLVDAPCSGEGLFRKSPAARELWSPARVAEFARLQARLLDTAVELLRPGGVLVYATCTFGVAENEAQVAALLDRRGDLAPEPIAVPGAAPALSVAGAHADLERACARWWPHRQTGEGHFVARLRRLASPGAAWRGARDAEPGLEAVDAVRQLEATGVARRSGPPPGARRRAGSRVVEAPPRAALDVFRSFSAAVLGLADDPAARLGGELRLEGEQLWLTPDRPAATALTPRRVGAPLGLLRKGRFEPHHALSRLLPDSGEAAVQLDLALDDPRLAAYLRGETVTAEAPDGWLLVRAQGLPLGWAKAKRGELNNRYPRGLRH